MRTPYWNPRTETLSRERLEALQLAKVRDLVDWTLAAAPWQARRLREAGVDSSDVIRTRDDVRRLPFLTRDEWMESQAEDPPFGEVLTQPVDAAIRYHTT